MSEITLEMAAAITQTESDVFHSLVYGLTAVSLSINSAETFVGFDLPHLGKLLTVSVERLEGRCSTRFELLDAAELDAADANDATFGVQ